MFDRMVRPRDFDVSCQVGRGNFGNVYQVVHRKSGQTLAMKLIDKAKYSSAEMKKTAVVERDILAKVQHPYIVQLHYPSRQRRTWPWSWTTVPAAPLSSS